MTVSPARLYGYLTRAREILFERMRPLTHEQYTREFSIGCGSLARVLAHVMISEWYYIQRMLRRDAPPFDQWPVSEDEPPTLAEMEALWRELAGDTLAALHQVRDWSERIEYPVMWQGSATIVSTCAADIFTQLVLHEVHHRAQVMNMLRRLGVAVDDVDFNALMYDRKPA